MLAVRENQDVITIETVLEDIMVVEHLVVMERLQVILLLAAVVQHIFRKNLKKFLKKSNGVFSGHVQLPGCLPHQILPCVYIRIMPGKAYDEWLLCIHNAHIIAQGIILAGFVRNGYRAADFAVELVIHLLKEQHIQRFL